MASWHSTVRLWTIRKTSRRRCMLVLRARCHGWTYTTTFQDHDQRNPKISTHVGVTLAFPILLTGKFENNSRAANVRFGSRLCKNSASDLPRATIESWVRALGYFCALDGCAANQSCVRRTSVSVFTQPGSKPAVKVAPALRPLSVKKRTFDGTMSA